jgi:AraC family transcriptional regulator, regulatory protein of adaptative response / methylated-DNA-[protein]-cysteine methyltransferase
MLITNPVKIKKYYQALLDKESSYVGIFYVGVKTTTVFCIATCRARKPKFDNVEFYSSFKDALNAGYRPCKICKPTENSNEAPEQVAQAMQLVRDHPKEKISDYQLRQYQISPELVRRWFKKHYGLTFQTYQRMYRINNAFLELKSGKKATATAFDTGYESLSGFGYTYKKLVGQSPSNSIENKVILISRLTTPIGPMFICATEKGICLLEFVDRKMLETEFKDIQKHLQASIITGENNHIKQAKVQLAEYFQGKRKHFDISLHTLGTGFQNSVWQILKTIPYGETTTYQQQAININNPKAVRAVASANGFNRISIFVPCHRVIAKDGNLMGYGGGLERKRWLIEHEKAHA